MIKGVIIGEGLKLDHALDLSGLTVRITRRDVSASSEGGQPELWTFLEVEGPDELADPLAQALAEALRVEGGWYADFRVADDHVVVFADKVFRYRAGDAAGREEAQRYGRAMGVPAHQLDWSD